MAGSRMAASSPMIASTATISSRTTPSSPALLGAYPRRRTGDHFAGICAKRSALPALNVRRRAGAALLAVRAVRDDVVRSMLAGRAVDVGAAPGVGGNLTGPQVRPVPGVDAAGPRGQRGEAFAGGRIAAGIEIEQVERAREALDLDAGGLDLRHGQIVEHARADQGHDQPDDGDHHQDFDEREAGFPSPRPAARPLLTLPYHLSLRTFGFNR